MQLVVNRRTSVNTSYVVDTQKVSLKQLKDCLPSIEGTWAEDCFDSEEQFADFINSDPDAAWLIFELCNVERPFGDPQEYFLEDETFFFSE